MISKYVEHLKVCIDVYGDSWQAYYAAAECIYWDVHNQAPEWGCFIERVEFKKAGNVYIHKDREGAL
jgi:hypothetical protein